MIAPDREPLEVEHLLTEDQRRTVSIDDHAAFRESLAPKMADELDDLIEEIRAAEFEGKGARP